MLYLLSMGLPGLVIIGLMIACAVHAVRSGRDMFWIWIILIVPGLGALVYFLTQILPGLTRGSAARKIKGNVTRTIDPGRDRRQIEAQLEVADTLDNRLKLARECVRLRDFPKAVEIYRTCLRGMHATDADILLELATAQFEAEDPAGTHQTLTELHAANPDFKSPPARLLSARALEALGETDRALEEYAIASVNFAGEEARLRHARLLAKVGRAADARRIVQEVVSRAQASPAFYRNREKAWIDEARGLLGRLPA